MKYSPFLRKLLDYGKLLDGRKTDALTAERFLVSIMDAGFDHAIELENDDLLHILCIFSDLVTENHLDYGEIREALMRRIREKKDLRDGGYFRRCLEEAERSTQKLEQDEVLAQTVLECILKEPTPYIRECMSGKPAPKDEEGFPPEELMRRFNEIFGVDEVDEVDEVKPIPIPEWEASELLPDPVQAMEELTKKSKQIREELLRSVCGQDQAVSVFIAGYFQAELLAMTDKNRRHPRATFLFAGPPGVGKTFLAEKAAEILKLPFMRIDMSEYSDKEASLEFSGSDSVYKHGKEGNVTSFVDENPHCVLLFDEIEKAHINVIHLFLQILDAGRLRDSHMDKEIPFNGAILIFTTNAGKQLYEQTESTDLSGMSRKVILKALQRDVDPSTGVPFFPAAICSRFASGNVVMFNHIAAHDLRTIAKREVLRHAANFERRFGIRTTVDESVYTALLFAEGASADARTIKSRAGSFFEDELFELFRLLDSKKAATGIRKLKSIHIGMELPSQDRELTRLFSREELQEVLVFSSEEVFEQCCRSASEIGFAHAGDMETAEKILRERDISFVLIDVHFGVTGKQDCLNIEDAASAARDFFWFTRESLPEMPVFLLQFPGEELHAEEQLSFLRQGVRGVITLSGDGGFREELREIGEQLHQQKSMNLLARSNKLVTFETAQAIRDRGRSAEITLFDFELTVAVEAEDSESVLASVSRPEVSFDQVIGAEDAKRELRSFTEYLKNPKKYVGTGLSAPKGVLLYGPPGTGKTMLAKALARESDVTFVTAEGNEFRKKYSGEGAEKVHAIFRTARKYAPAILFVDEIDAIARERGGDDSGADSDATLTAFLTEMDGFKSDTTRPVFVLAATNFDAEPGSPRSLDRALMRRFDRRIFVDLPTREERFRYIRMKLDESPAFDLSEEKLRNIAVRSTGMSLAELASVIELSLRSAIRDGELRVTDDVFEEAFETFRGGEIKKWDASQLQRIARHEAGHAFLCWQSGETPSYVTVVARGDHGGYMQHEDREGKTIYTRDEMLARIRTALGGRAAELVYYGEKEGVSTGASGDLASATSMAKQMICAYGMDDQFGLAVVDGKTEGDGKLAAEIREAVNRILSEELEEAVRRIASSRAAVDALVARLLSENHLTGDKIEEVFGACPEAPSGQT